MEDNLKKSNSTKTIKSKSNNIFENGSRPQFIFKMKTTSTKIIQLKTIKSKNKDCGTAPGNPVLSFSSISTRCLPLICIEGVRKKVSFPKFPRLMKSEN